MDKGYSKDFHDWIKYADEDLKLGNTLLEEHDEFYAAICFHFQQAGEKYLKAFIIKNNLVFEKIHDLRKINEICKNFDSEFQELKENADYLTDFYTDTRYPASWGLGIIKEHAERAREAACKIGEFVKKKIK